MEKSIEALEASVGLLSDTDVDTEAAPLYTEKDDFSPRTHSLVDRFTQHLGSCRGRFTEIIQRIFLFLLPSFVAARLARSDQDALSSKPRPTAYLDGLRGMAAWAVVNGHIIFVLDRVGGVGFGHGGEHYHEFYKLPIIRLVSDGSFAVALFFVISGYALSISPVSAMRKGPRNAGTAIKKLASCIIRRPMRLFLPCWATILIVFTLIRIGYFEYFINREELHHTHYLGWATLANDWPPRDPSFWAQAADAGRTMMRLLWVFGDWRYRPWLTNYSFPLWTIPLEYRSSLVLYLTHAALFVMRRRARIAVLCLLIFVGAWQEAFDFPLFWIGCLIAELSPLLSGDSDAPQQGRLVTAGCAVSLVVGLYVGSFPEWGGPDTPEYQWMIPLTPWSIDLINRWWTGVGALFVVVSIDRLSLVKRVLTSRAVQYMGKISFSFYLMHFWILHTMGSAVFHYAYEITGVDHWTTAFIGFVLGYATIWAVIIWISDIFRRSVDKPSIDLGFKMEQWLLEDVGQ